MGKSRRIFTQEFKLAAVKEVQAGKPLAYVARHLELHANVLQRWVREFQKRPTKAFSGQGKRLLAESREAELERKIGQLTMENDFLKKVLRSFEEQLGNANGGGSSMSRSGLKRKT